MDASISVISLGEIAGAVLAIFAIPGGIATFAYRAMKSTIAETEKAIAKEMEAQNHDIRNLKGRTDALEIRSNDTRVDIAAINGAITMIRDQGARTEKAVTDLQQLIVDHVLTKAP